MDIAYLHLVTNHIPIIGLPFALVLLIAGIRLKNDDIKAFGLLAFTVLGFITLGVYLLGQGGEDFVEELAGTSHDAIENHRKMATLSLVLVGITGLLSLFGLIFYNGFRLLLRRDALDKIESEDNAPDDGKTENDDKIETHARPYFPKWLIFGVLLLALLSSGVLGYTGKLGGKIRHTEFYGGAASTEEESGKNRRGKTDPNNQAQTNSETKQTTDTEETDTENGKGRGRNRGKK